MPTDWDTIKEIVCTALELSGQQRAAYLEGAYKTNPDLRIEVEQLLAGYGKGQEFFEILLQDLNAPPLELQSLAPGDLVAERYQVKAFLARGGSGEVYEAWDNVVKESVALKVLRARWDSEPAIEQFRQEIRLSRKIQNPHVCRVHDAGRFMRFDGSPTLFLSMELLKGETLAARLRHAGALPKEQALYLLRQIADGLEAAHRKGILHRDLKSSNTILVPESDGTELAVITDFGLALPVDEESRQVIAGTPAYMAPEQVEGGPLSRATDIYALAVIAFEMSTGRVPFDGVSPDEQARARLTGDPPSPRAYNPAIDPRWERVILKGLARDPSARHQSARAMIDALERSYKKPVAALACLLAVGGGIWGWADYRQHIAEAPLSGSVLVANFDSAGEDSKIQFAGFREELIAELAGIPGVNAIAQTTPQNITATPEGLKRVRREFRAASVLTGSMRPEPGGSPPDESRVTFRLTDTGTGALLWQGSYRARLRDLPQIQETVALASVDSLRIRLAAPQIEAAGKRNSKNPDAYQAYLLGHYFAGRRNTADLRQAIAYYQRATSADGDYALAWAGMAGAYTLLANRGVMPVSEAYRLSEECVDHSLSLDAGLAEAWLVKGMNAHHAFWRWDDAERYFRHAAELAPGLAQSHHWLAGLLSERGRHEDALREAQAALQLDPLSVPVNNAYAAYLFRARRDREAVDRYETLLRQQPAFMGAKLGLADAYLEAGRNQEAVNLVEGVASSVNRASFALAELGYAYGRVGRQADAEAIIEELKQLHAAGKALASEIAQVYDGLADRENTINWLEQGFAAHDEELRALKTSPAYDRVRSDPRFAALVAKIGL